jgi:hypothetical protein
VDYSSSKHKELSEQLTTWWSTQTDFKTKRGLADFLKVHPDTLGDYFSGRSFPKSDIANRLCELTNAACLKPHGGADPLLEMAPQESPSMSLLPAAAGVAASVEKPSQPDIAGVTGPSEEKYRLGEIHQLTAGLIPRESPKKGERYDEISVVISLQRTVCPFCAHDIARFGSCRYCGQHFTWANVPQQKDGLS